MIALATLATMVACRPDPAPVTASLRLVTPKTIVVNVETKPGVIVTRCLDGCPRAKADATGHAELTVDPETIPESEHRIDVLAVHDGLFKEEIIGRHSVPFAPSPKHFKYLERLMASGDQGRLSGVVPSADKPWVTLMTTNESETDDSACASVTPANDNTVLARTSRDVWAFLGTPGARVVFGSHAFTMESSGLHTWSPTDDELAALFGGRDRATITVRAEVEGQPASSAVLELSLLGSCQRARGNSLHALAVAKRPLSSSLSRREFMLALRQDGSSFVIGDNGADAPAAARRVVIEEEVSRARGSHCKQRIEGLERGDRVEVMYAEIEPQLVTSRISLYELPSYTLIASTVLEPNEGCVRESKPSRSSIEAWVRAQRHP